MRYLLLVILLSPALAALWLWQQWPGAERVPAQYNPFAPVNVDDPLNALTTMKLKALGSDPERCAAALARARDAGAIDYATVGSPEIGQCQLENVVRVRSTSVAFSSSFLATCPMALAWTLYERHRLQPAAREIFDAPVSRVDHVGSFACRNVYGRESGRRSEHATAEALDVTGFRFADGSRARVIADWEDGGPRGEFLHRALSESCDTFGNALGPEYNAAHRDHFHLGMRGYGICR
ncbi:extensin-like domain-containing protein [Kushneria aurantia]|uniref:Extensin family protein n=1 Tax=Kushneria aurantia TaxID=504092 RepID=A0ABV6G602_9GAMM|nr:extensin family protein [Kushneria aurantia]